MAEYQDQALATHAEELVVDEAAGSAVATASATQESTASPGITSPGGSQPTLTPVSKLYIVWMTLANFGASMAFIVPLSYSLALRIDQLSPGHEEILGYTTGIAQAIFILTSPLVGQWSDRTFSRFGRRRPFLAGGVVVGLIGLAILAQAPNIPVMIAGWTVALLGWATTAAAIQFLQADRIPEEQRGKISGLTNLSAQIAPIMGIGIASVLVGISTSLVFIVPGIIGAVLVLAFVFMRSSEGDARGLARPQSPVNAKTLFASYVFNPKQFPDFGWNWLGRFVFFIGLYFNTSFSTFFYAQRLNLSVQEVAGTVAMIGILGVVAAMFGAIGGGFLSDKFQRRKLFTGIGAALFAVGALVEAFAHSMPTLIVGTVFMNLAIAAFGAVDQAIVMKIIPSRAESGRYMSIIGFSQKIPSAIAPLMAPVIIGFGMLGSEKNYTLLYLVGGALAVAGGVIIMTKVKGVR